MNKQEIEDQKYLKQFINLYNQCRDINSLKNIDNEEKRVFLLKTKGSPIKFGYTKDLLGFIPEKEGLYDFWKDNKAFWIIPLEILPNRVYGFILRGYNKEYRVFRLNNDLPVLFGLYDFYDFNFGRDPIILTEGIKDALVLKTIYQYSIALSTAGLTSSSMDFLKSLTNRFLLVYDNDKAGKDAIERDRESLMNAGCKAISIGLRLKDPGTYINFPNELAILNSNIKQYL